MSRELSDAEDKTRLIVDDPSYRAELVREVNDRLTQKYKSGTNRASISRKEKVVYVKVDSPIPELRNNVRIPRWAIDDGYFKTHKQEIDKKITYIDMDAVQPPDLTEFRKKYGKADREYLDLDARPNRARTKSISAARAALGNPNGAKTTPEVVRPDIEIGSSLTGGDPAGAPVAGGIPPTPNGTLAQHLSPEFLPSRYAPAKTANELVAEYAAEPAQRQCKGIDSPIFTLTLATNNPDQLAAGPSNTTMSVAGITPHTGESRLQNQHPTSWLPRTSHLPRVERKEQKEEGGGANNRDSVASGGKKMPTRLRHRAKGG